MAYERLTSTDASFLFIESDHEPQHVGSLAEVEAGPLRDESGRIRIDELRTFTEARLHRVPRLRQKVMFVPFDVGRPIWVDDDHFDIDYHFRLTALPAPGGAGQLDDLFGRLQSLPLDRSRPLWEMWVVDGLEGDRVGLIIKSHHALGDGIANVDLVMALVDLERDPEPDPPAPEYHPSPAPSPRRLLIDTVAEELLRPAELTRAAFDAARNPRRTQRTITDATQALITFGSKPSPAPWNRVVSAHRRWARADVSLEDVKAIRNRTEVTINDVVLELCTGALREYLLAHGEDVGDRELRAMVPVSRRPEDDHGQTLGNKVSLILADLPVGLDDPAERLERIHAQTSEMKASGLADGVETMVSAAGEVTMLAVPLARLLSRSIPMNLVVTNIPGPPVPLYVRGARVLAAYPYVEVLDNEGLTIAVISYDGNLSFGITADLDEMRDLDVLAEGIEKGIARLADSVAVTGVVPDEQVNR